MKNTAHPMDRMANWCSHGGWFTLAPMLVLGTFTFWSEAWRYEAQKMLDLNSESLIF